MSALNRMLFLEQRKAITKRSHAIALYIVIGTIAATASHLAAFAIGDRMGFERGKASEMNRPKPAPVVLQPASLIACDKVGREEFLRVCKARVRMERVR